MPRITKSRDPILAGMRAEYMAALDAMRFLTIDVDGEWDAGFLRVERARKAVNDRAAMFRPRRVRKAERKAGEMGRIVRYVAAQPKGFRNHVPQTALAISEAARAASYRDHLILWRAFIYRGDAERRETVEAHREALQWAAFHRKSAAAFGRRLP